MYYGLHDPDNVFEVLSPQHQGQQGPPPGGDDSDQQDAAIDSDEQWQPYIECADVLTGHHTAWPVTKVLIDPKFELVWCGRVSGQVTSYKLGERGTSLQKYSSFRISNTAPVIDILSHNDGILCLAEDSLQFRMRGGAPLIVSNADKRSRLCAIGVSSSYRSNQAVVGLAHSQSLVVELGRGTVCSRFELERDPKTIKFAPNSELMYTMTVMGILSVRDPRIGFQQLNWIKAFDVTALSMDIVGNYLAVCGCSEWGTPVRPDRAIKIYDLRRMDANPLVVKCVDGPGFLKADPLTSSQMFVGYYDGHIELRDCPPTTTDQAGTGDGGVQDFTIAVVNLPNRLSAVTCMDVSPSGDVAMFGDNHGILHIWSATDSPTLNLNPIDPLLPHIKGTVGGSGSEAALLVDDPHMSFSDCPLINYDRPELLLSHPRVDDVFDVAKPLPQIDPALLASMQVSDFVGYVKNPRQRLRNQATFPPGWRKKWLSEAPDKEDSFNQTEEGPVVPLLHSEQRRRQIQGRYWSGYHQSHPSNVSGANSSSAPNTRPTSATARTRSQSGLVPPHLQKVTIQYSKFGIEDFDFGFYNQTRYGGLESHLPNSYCNALLQTLFFAEGYRELAMAHALTSCRSKDCVLCELGFLFCMLKDSKGRNCHAGNLLKVVAQRPEAHALGIIEPKIASTKTPYGTLVQTANRFFLERTAKELRDQQDLVERLFGFMITTATPCPCGAVKEMSVHRYAVELEDSEGSAGLASLLSGGVASVNRITKQVRSFCDQLKSSLQNSTVTRAWCSSCRKYQMITTSKRLAALPLAHFAVNCPIRQPAHSTAATTSNAASMKSGSRLSFNLSDTGGDGRSAVSPMAFNDHSFGSTSVKNELRMRHWLLPSIRIGIDDKGEVHVSPHNDNSSGSGETGGKSERQGEVRDKGRDDDRTQYGVEEGEIYDLHAVIVEIRVSPTLPARLVAYIRMPPRDGGENTSWYVFNDFLVQKIDQSEVFDFSPPWKRPAVIYFTRRGSPVIPAAIDATRETGERIDVNAVFNAPPVNKPKHLRPTDKVVPLSEEELRQLKPGYRCAIDAEFVKLASAEAEIHSDKSALPYQTEKIPILARLSVIRGMPGPLYGVPFIDDYIATRDPILDYVSDISGIHKGDLDPTTSSYELHQFKDTYRKLRHLISSGCTLIGHGLGNDFRTINIIAPPAQVLDTVKLYSSPTHSRLISLRFLTWSILHRNIQDGQHSSVEDAKATLELYDKYQSLADCGMLEDVLDDVYDKGHIFNWRPPSDDIGPAAAAPTPPVAPSST
ncbi:poly(A)-specific ribonuclease [Spiromyces aspiralis]|uniref:Poly(A)-specific ribonuclease n=1 Tax=Spiromyces aspiralis TaxID=68401 RepID=A0ACC1HTN1_9FUNG|nr:poly(A)-specific ribonuclease [Spiromyces aspiralis]